MIRAAFVELLGEKKNMETITVGELAERADIAKSTFYNHYDDVYAVAEEFENELIAKLSAVLDEIVPHQPENLASAHPRAELQQEEFIEAVLLGLP